MNAERVLAGIVIIGIMAAAWVSAVRSAALWPQSGAEIALSLAAVRESSATQAFSFEAILQRYRGAGLTTLLISGTSLGSLIESGGTGYGADYPVLVALQDGQVAVRGNPALARWLEERLSARLGPSQVSATAGPDLTLLSVQGSSDDELMALQLGLHPADLALAQKMGWRVAAEYADSALTAPQALFEGLPAGVPVLFMGSAPLSGEVRQLMAQGEHPLLIDHSGPPFTEGMAPGAAALAAELDWRAIKLFRVTFSHTLTDVLTAVKERSMQMVLIQPYHLSGDLEQDLAEQTARWSDLSNNLQAAGYSLGQALPVQSYRTPWWTLTLAGMAVGGAAGLFVQANWGAAAALVIFGGTVAALGVGQALQGLALAAAGLLPALGALRALGAGGLTLRLGWLFGTGIAAGLVVTALLGDLRFVLELSLFRGVKAALLAPSALFLLAVAWRERKALIHWRPGPVRVWHLGAALILLAALPLLLLRSGSEADLHLISAAELKLRSLLEETLVVRPRFKEFLVGWPLLVLAHGLLQQGRRLWGTALLAVGLIAPASLVNSFTHLHTPMWLSALRGLSGFIFGAAIGGAFLLALRLRKGERHA